MAANAHVPIAIRELNEGRCRAGGGKCQLGPNVKVIKFHGSIFCVYLSLVFEFVAAHLQDIKTIVSPLEPLCSPVRQYRMTLTVANVVLTSFMPDEPEILRSQCGVANSAQSLCEM